MKKTLSVLLVLVILLSGCQTGHFPPAQTDPTATDTLPTETQSAVPLLPLPEQGIPLEEGSSLYCIPNEAVESMGSPEMHLFGNGLLLSECIGEELVLKHISLMDGTLLAEYAAPASFGTKVFVGRDRIGLCDRESGLITFLDENLQLLGTREVPPVGEDWYLSSELDKLYVFSFDRGLLIRDLQTGEERWLVDNGFRVSTKCSGNSYVIFEYTDRADQKSCYGCLNLSTGDMETLPIGGEISSGSRQGETWVLQSREPEDLYTVITVDSASRFHMDPSSVQLLAPRQHLLAADPSGRNLSLYETDGTFLSQCALPQSSNAVIGSDFIWSSAWDGYFFTDFFDFTCRLMFWDVSAAADGADLQLFPAEQTQQSQPILQQQLYDRAAELSARFDLDIRIAEQCSADYSHYESYLLTDPFFVSTALDILEENLSLYPEGFFRQLLFGHLESIRIELVGSLTIKDDISTHPTSAGGFAQDAGSYYAIVFDGFLFNPGTLFHEFSHIIDKKLKWDSLIREDALYSEDAWLALQPEGFRYAMSYTDVPEDLLPDTESRYFISSYARTYPTEDRAELMESAMQNYTWDFEPGSGTRAKMQYYADCIRDCFDTEGWPETTAWEQVLQ